MAFTDEYRTFLVELLGGIGPVEVKRMFGGAGVFLDGLMFALVAQDGLYFKVDGTNRPDFEAEGMTPFVYATKGKTATMSYWRVPDYLFDDSDEISLWAHKAYQVALSARLKKNKSR